MSNFVSNIINAANVQKSLFHDQIKYINNKTWKAKTKQIKSKFMKIEYIVVQSRTNTGSKNVVTVIKQLPTSPPLTFGAKNFNPSIISTQITIVSRHFQNAAQYGATVETNSSQPTVVPRKACSANSVMVALPSWLKAKLWRTYHSRRQIDRHFMYCWPLTAPPNATATATARVSTCFGNNVWRIVNCH